MCRTSDLLKNGPCVHAQIPFSFLHFLACVFLYCFACVVRNKDWEEIMESR